MIVYAVMQSEKLVFGKPMGASRVRGIFSSQQKANEHIGPIEKESVKCECCGSDHSNPKYTSSDDWKKKLFIKQFEVQ